MYVNKLKHFNSAICLMHLPLNKSDYRAFAEPAGGGLYLSPRTRYYKYNGIGLYDKTLAMLIITMFDFTSFVLSSA